MAIALDCALSSTVAEAAYGARLRCSMQSTPGGIPPRRHDLTALQVIATCEIRLPSERTVSIFVKF